MIKKVAIIGTQGLPAQYGGFETLVENLVTKKTSENICYTVFCSARSYKTRQKTYNGAKLKYVSFFYANGMQSVFYDIISMIQSIRKYDTILILGTSGCIFLPIFRLLFSKNIIVNIDGLEYRREKWGRIARWFLKLSESKAVRFANIIIADNEAIKDYVHNSYAKESTLIAYGADHALKTNISEQEQFSLLDSYFLQPQKYAFALCRIEPENNCHLILKAFADSGEKLVFIGNWYENKYGRELHYAYNSSPNIRLLNSLYDFNQLYTLRKNCRFYVHGHSAGGTNPSLVEAMLTGSSIVAFDCIYNRKTTEDKALYYTNEKSLMNIIFSFKDDEFSLNGEVMSNIATKRYTWKSVVKQYEKLY